METQKATLTVADEPFRIHEAKDNHPASTTALLGFDLARLAYQASVLEIPEAQIQFYTEICLPHRFGGGPMRICDQLEVILSRVEDRFEERVGAIWKDMLRQRLLEYAYSPRWIIEQTFHLARKHICGLKDMRKLGWRQKQDLLMEHRNADIVIGVLARIPSVYLVGWIANRAKLQFIDSEGELPEVPVDEGEEDHAEEES